MNLETTKNWTEREFLAYCLAFAAMADLKVLQSELDHITELVGEKLTKSAFEMIVEMNDHQRLEVLKSYKDQYYADEESKQNLLDHMHNVFLSDDKYDHLEKMTMNFLSKLL